MDTRPYYTRRLPAPQDLRTFATDRIDLSNHHLPAFVRPDGAGVVPDLRPLADAQLDARAAAVVVAAVRDPLSVKVMPTTGNLDGDALLERHAYGADAPTIYVPSPKILAVMAYEDYFPGAPNAARLRPLVSEAIMASSPGWCGSFGPDVDALASSKYEGNYDMTQQFLLPLAYAYYDLLTPAAREKLIVELLAGGRVKRAGQPDTVTSGTAPNDWSRAGHVQLVVNLAGIPETENHVLMIATTRYLTNQLMYPRVVCHGPDTSIAYDNRRNGDPSDSRPTCMDQVLGLLRNKLRNDFSEYNAKPYQEETRRALLNLYSYAYDAEVRLAAGMVLDYVSAHIAVSSCDARRMVPFRRRNEGSEEGGNVHQAPAAPGFLDVGLLDTHGADPMSSHFALLAGNARAYAGPDPRVWRGERGPARPWPWGIGASSELFIELACDYRIAPSIHDLFVNDLHRRFYQRIHRRSMMDEPGQQRNCDNMEIYSGSPSYLISAGGRPAIWVIPGKAGHGYQQQNLGVAVPISFMPTGAIAGHTASDSRDLIQILQLSDRPTPENGINASDVGGTENYGVGPDFACGFRAHLPGWTGVPAAGDGLFFVEKRATPDEPAAFYLALHRFGDFVLLEAFDAWLHPEVSFDAFKAGVMSHCPSAPPTSGVESVYTTYFGNRIHYVIWNNREIDNHQVGSKVLRVEYDCGDPADTLAAAGNDAAPFLSGNVLQSPCDGVVEVHNPALGTTLTLDWRDPAHLVRTAEDGQRVQAGPGFQVWVDFDWTGGTEGDFFRPFNTFEAATNAIRDGGEVCVLRGTDVERTVICK